MLESVEHRDYIEEPRRQRRGGEGRPEDVQAEPLCMTAGVRTHIASNHVPTCSAGLVEKEPSSATDVQERPGLHSDSAQATEIASRLLSVCSLVRNVVGIPIAPVHEVGLTVQSVDVIFRGLPRIVVEIARATSDDRVATLLETESAVRGVAHRARPRVRWW